jgi:IK cytokine
LDLTLILFNLQMDDAIIDSDDEVDFTKMDKGNKKGPIGRWDFDTTEEYSDYMSSKEALPKAAFQYGLKMTDGRKTRKNKTEMQKIDQEWQKIQKIITKRKGEGGSGEVDFKKAKN